MKIKMVGLFFFLILGLSGYSQISGDIRTPVIPFEQNKSTLGDSARIILDSLANRLVDYNFSMILVNSCCAEEIKVDSLIGIKRSLSIINYLCSKYSFSRSSFFIEDNYPLPSTYKKSCEISGINFKFIRLESK